MAQGFYTKKLLKRLREELGLDIPEDTVIHRTRAGRHQLAAGGWCWWISLRTGATIGSFYTVKELAKSPYLSSQVSEMSSQDLLIDPQETEVK